MGALTLRAGIKMLSAVSQDQQTVVCDQLQALFQAIESMCHYRFQCRSSLIQLFSRDGLAGRCGIGACPGPRAMAAGVLNPQPHGFWGTLTVLTFHPVLNLNNVSKASVQGFLINLVALHRQAAG